MANISVTSSQSNINVDVNTSTVTVGTTLSNVTVGESFIQQISEILVDNGTQSGNISIDLDAGRMHTVTLDGDMTGLTLANVSAGRSVTLIITQDGLGGRNLDTTTYPSNWTGWDFANDYSTLDTTGGNWSVLSIMYDGSVYYASLVVDSAILIANSELANSTMVLNGLTVNLGDTVTLPANLDLANTDQLAEGVTNLYFTAARARSNISVSNASGDGSLSYDAFNGIITYTGPNQDEANARIDAAPANVRAHFSANASTIDYSTSTGAFDWATSVTHQGNIDLTADIKNTNGLTLTGTNLVYRDHGTGDTSLSDSTLTVSNYLSGGGVGIRLDGEKAIGGTTYISANAYPHDAFINDATSTFTLMEFTGATRIKGPTDFSPVVWPSPLVTPTAFNSNATISGFDIKSRYIDIIGDLTMSGNGNITTTTGTVTAGTVLTNTITPNTTADVTVTTDLVVQGNVEVAGNLNYENVTDLYVTDQKITLNANAATDATVEIIANRPVAGANTVLRWNETDDKWQFTNDGSTYQNIIGLTDLSVSTNTASGNGTLSYSNSTGVFSFTPADTSLATKTTDDLTEGSTNLYFTSAAANTAIADYIGDSANSPFDFNGNLSTQGELTVGFGNLNVNGGNVGISGYFLGDGLDGLAGGLDIKASGGNIDITATSGAVNFSSNVDFNSSTAVDNLYGLKFDKGKNMFISSPNSATKSPNFVFDIEKDSTDLQYERVDVYRNGSFGIGREYNKYGGSISSPAAVGNNDYITRTQYKAYDGTNDLIDVLSSSNSQQGGIEIATYLDYTATANITPVVYEISQRLDGNVNAGFPLGRFRLEPSGHIAFNASGIGRFSNDGGAANIALDGTITSKANIEARQTLIGAGLTVAGITYPTSDGSSGQVITTDGNGSLTFSSTGAAYGNVEVANFLANGFGSNTITTSGDITTTGFFEGDLNGAVTIDVYNDTVSTLTKGSTVYLTGGSTGDNPHVELADNTDSAKMPAIGVVRENIGASSIGQVVTSGEMNYTSHGYTLGADLYVNNSGGLTTVVPAGESQLLQKMGKVVGTNHIMVQGAFRTNAVPNLDNGNIFLGNASGKAVTATFTTEANAAILNYNGDITRMNQANISRISVGGGNIDLDSALLTFPDLQFYTETSGERYFIGAQMSASTSTGITDAYVKSRGNIASPSVLSNNDRILETDYYAHDGSNYIQTFGEHIYHDNATSGISAGTLPLAKEIYTKQDGDSSQPFDMSIVKFRADRTIAFNDTGTRGFGSGAGNANIQMDGTINTVSGINATGNISAGNVSTTIITATGDISAPTMTPQDITLKSFQETVVDLGTTNGDISSSVDANQGSIFTMVANGAVTFNSIANVTAGSSFVVKIKQDVTGGHALTSSMLFLGGNATLSAGANDIDVISVLYDGTDYLASLSHDYKQRL